MYTYGNHNRYIINEINQFNSLATFFNSINYNKAFRNRPPERHNIINCLVY